MTDFKEAAKAAACEINANVPNWQYTAPELIPVVMENSIKRHFAPLAELNEKLVEYVFLSEWLDEHMDCYGVNSDEWSVKQFRFNELRNDPAVQAAIAEGESK